MDEQPDHPPGEPGELQPPHRDHRAAAGDVGGRAQVVVAERLGRRAPPGLVADAAPGVQAGLHGDLGDPGELVQAHHVTGDHDLRVTGDAQVRADLDAPGPVLLGPGGRRDRRRHRRRRDPRGPQHGRRLIPGYRAVLGADAQPAAIHAGHDRVHVLLDPELVQGAGRLGRQLRAERGQRRGAAVEQQDPGVLGVDVPVFGAQRLGGHFADLPGQFHARRAGADQGEGEPAPPLGRVGRRLCHLESAEHPPPDDQRVLDGLHAGRVRGELVVPEVGLGHPRRHDQVVVAELGRFPARAGHKHLTPPRVDAGHLGQHEFHVLVLAQQVAQRGGDLPLGEDSRRALVEQRLEQVMRGPVDQGDLDRGPAQRPDREQAGEPASDDHHPALAALVVHAAPSLLGSVRKPAGQPAGSYQASRSGSRRSASLGPQVPLA